MELGYCEGYFRDLIDLYKKYLDLDIYIYFNNGRCFSQQNCSAEICRLMKERHPNLCKESKLKGLQYPLCCAGMLCYQTPIKVAGNTIGTICIGQKLIKGQEALSKNILEDSLVGVDADSTEIEYFISLMNKLDSIDPGLDGGLIKRIEFIKRHFFVEFNRSYYTEKRVSDLKRLAENLAHQFITPIQGIMGNAENLIYDIDGLPLTFQDIEIKEITYNIFFEIQKLALLADNLRNWIASEHNWLYKYDFQDRPILPIIMNSIKLFRNEAKSRGIIIKDPVFDCAAPPKLNISTEHMTRVFYNIISNAVKYSYDGIANKPRWIEIRCKEEFGYYCISTTNYGVGILPEELNDRIYQIGYRGKLAKDRNRYGSGLGLGVVERIIKDHGGMVKIMSEIQSNKDYGSSNPTRNPYKTTIKICLPLKNVGGLNAS